MPNWMGPMGCRPHGCQQMGCRPYGFGQGFGQRFGQGWGQGFGKCFGGSMGWGFMNRFFPNKIWKILHHAKFLLKFDFNKIQ